MSDKIAAIMDMWQKMKGTRTPWEKTWLDIANYFVPNKNNIYNSEIKGDIRGVELYETTGVNCVDLLSGALHTMLTNPATEWFGLTTGDEKQDELDSNRIWLYDTSKRIHETLNASNFQTEIHEVYQDSITFGTAPLREEEDDETDVRFFSHPIYECWIKENDKGVVDTVFRSFKYTYKQLVQKWGSGIFSESELFSMKKDESETFEVLHAVMPRAMEEINDKLGPIGYPFASFYILVDKNRMLEEKGFHEFPYGVPRWSKNNDEDYGRSPAMKSMPDNKMINVMKQTTVEAAQKMVNPPMMLPDDGFLMPPDLTPGGSNYYRAGVSDRIEPIELGGRVDFGNEEMEQTRNNIRKAFFIDQLQLVRGPQMTATETMQRTDENMRILSPYVARYYNELLKFVIERTFKILERKGKILPVPEGLKGKPISIKYLSTLSRIQRTTTAENIGRAISAAAPIINMNPQVMDNLDFDGTFRNILHTYGVNENLIRSVANRDNIRKERNQAAQMQQQLQQANLQADTANKLAPVINSGK